MTHPCLAFAKKSYLAPPLLSCINVFKVGNISRTWVSFFVLLRSVCCFSSPKRLLGMYIYAAECNTLGLRADTLTYLPLNSSSPWSPAPIMIVLFMFPVSSKMSKTPFSSSSRVLNEEKYRYSSRGCSGSLSPGKWLLLHEFVLAGDNQLANTCQLNYDLTYLQPVHLCVKPRYLSRPKIGVILERTNPLSKTW